MPSIGGRNVVLIDGAVNSSAETARNIRRPNIDGVAFLLMGKTTSPFAMRSMVDTTTANAANVEMDAYKALAGTLVTVVDNLAISHTLVMVLDVSPEPTREAKTVTGGINVSEGAAGFLVVATWTLQATVVD